MEIKITNKKKPLGSGGYSHVLPGTYKDQKVAVKRIQLLDATEDNEVKVMQQILDHPNIVKLLHVEDDENFRFIALELCVASLDKIFLDPENPRKYEGPELPNHLEIFSQLASGLEYIHSKQLIHRDIKPANILVHVDDTRVVTMKLADFGLSKSVNERGTCSMNSGVKGTNKWLAPELLKSIANEEPQGRGTVKSDVFALGLVFAYLLLDGRHLYGSNENEINANIVADTQVNINKIHPFHYALELIKNMLKHDDRVDRISSGEVVIQLKSIKQKLAVKEQELSHLCTKKSLDFDKFEILNQLAIDVHGKSIGGSSELEKAFQVILDKLVEDTKKLENDPQYRRKMADTWNNFIYTLSNYPQTFQDKVVQQMIHQAAEAQKDSTLASMSSDQIFGNHLELTNSDNSEDKEVIRRQGEERQVKGNSTMASSEPNINLHIPQDILDKIHDYLKNATDKLLNILMFLSKKDAVTQRTIQILRTVFEDEMAFQGIVDQLVEDTETLKNDENYYPVMAAIWNNFITPWFDLFANKENVVGRVQRISLSQWLTEYFFKSPKEKALEDAYKFLKLNSDASVTEINSSFRHLALKYHPDKGGSYEDWHKLQIAMAVIKLSKGEI